MDEKPDLETRVRQFNMLALPGQPQGMHMGTSYLVGDLWREVGRLRDLNTALTHELEVAHNERIDNLVK